mmetsp:Transcript_84184/g.225059  ORF Transcript_84184/g.225059 Transcript_84184/m.225059 type:complete len:117 (+) Transcript_84184:192-542(+)
MANSPDTSINQLSITHFLQKIVESEDAPIDPGTPAIKVSPNTRPVLAAVQRRIEETKARSQKMRDRLKDEKEAEIIKIVEIAAESPMGRHAGKTLSQDSQVHQDSINSTVACLVEA